MSDDGSLEEQVLREYGMTREEWVDVKEQKEWETEQMGGFFQSGAQMAGRPKTRAEFRATNIDKEIEKRRAKKAEERLENNIVGCLRVLHQDKGKEFYLKVMVDTGANVNAITYGMLIDYELETRKVLLDEPEVIHLAVGKFEYSEQISLRWMGKGNEQHGAATFCVLPRGQANITDRVILSKEWLNKRDLLYDRDPSPSLKPLYTKKPTESEEAARKQEHQRAMNDRASSSKAKEAYQKKEGQTRQDNSSMGPSRQNDASK